MTSKIDYMNFALKLAKKGMFTTGVNPRVGCVIVNNKKIVGTGFHQREGELHAEVFALKQAEKKAKSATAYVTLEPCSHVGKNPPCADALIQAGIKKVVVCNLDPNPLVAGKGIKKLEDAGIKVIQGVKEKKGLKLNQGFFHRMQTGLPFVKWIDNSISIPKLHYWRARSNALLIDIESIIHNKWNNKVSFSKMSKKYKNLANDFAVQQPMCVVLDKDLKIDLSNEIFKNKTARFIIMTASTNTIKKNLLKKIGVEIINLPEKHNDINLDFIFKWLGRQKINNLLVEINPS